MKNHTLAEIITELSKFRRQRLDTLEIAVGHDGDEDAVIEGERVSDIDCVMECQVLQSIPCPRIWTDEREAMKLNDILTYLRRLPIEDEAPVKLEIAGHRAAKYDCKVLDGTDIMRHVTLGQ